MLARHCDYSEVIPSPIAPVSPEKSCGIYVEPQERKQSSMLRRKTPPNQRALEKRDCGIGAKDEINAASQTVRPSVSLTENAVATIIIMNISMYHPPTEVVSDECGFPVQFHRKPPRTNRRNSGVSKYDLLALVPPPFGLLI